MYQAVGDAPNSFYAERTGLRWDRGDETLSRLFDVAAAAVLLVFLMPMLCMLALIVAAHDGGPSLFRHRRIGRGGHSFYCLKFRTMAVDAESRLQTLLSSDPQAKAFWDREHKLKADPRITGIGLFLRKTSLDELPQLFNVLRGDMSLVGPRPIVEAEVRHYGRYFRAYCAVRPGITGLWQVSGRNDVSHRRRVALDVAFVRRRSFLLRMRILLATVPAVLLRKGSY